MTEIFNRLRDLPSRSVQERVETWKRSAGGRKVIGCFPVYCPVELVHAAGMLPVLLAGGSESAEVCQKGGLFQAYACSIGRSTSQLQREGLLEALDGMLFPSICEVSRALSGVLSRRMPGKPCHYIHFPQNLESSHAVDYLVAELERVKRLLEEVAGKPVTNEAVRESFACYNRRAELLEKLDAMRAERQPVLSAAEFYLLRLAGMNVSPEEHIELLERAVREAQNRPRRAAARLRMVMVGAFCERPPVEMFDVLERLGVQVVADDMLLGQMWWRKPLPVNGEGLRALAEHYVKYSPVCSVVYGRGPLTLPEHVIRLLSEREAEGVIIASAKSCHPALADVSCIARTCEDNGVPYLKVEFEEGMKVFTPIRMLVDALIEARAALPYAGTENGRAGR